MTKAENCSTTHAPELERTAQRATFERPQNKEIALDVDGRATVGNLTLKNEDEADDEISISPNNVISAAQLKRQSRTEAEANEADGAKEDIQQDAATMRVALIVHACLVFFACVLVLAVVLAAIAVSQFGFLTFIFLFVLGGLFCGLVWLVNRALKDEAQLKPVRQKIQRWKALATTVVMNELHSLKVEWNEHLLLTNDASDYSLYDDDDCGVDVGGSTATRITSSKRKGRSVLFKLVKPFLNRRRKKQAASKKSPTCQMQQTGSEIV